ncbi:bifunctional phosphopantothenoylcysteine decarboxylase/phosphopantothenate--cysteine ligase CoaBC [bacterium]|nr:bifunctional phosphopantothenoylcysteine decarboxylase/phosphopantothenate--cysteine ligase CoaBC [bacterium]
MFGVLKNKKIVLGVTGGVACYKSVFLLRLLVKAGADVSVVATENALHFVGRATFESLSKNKLLVSVFDVEEYDKIAHISLAQESDLIVIAPASANTIAKIANGIADNLLTSMVLAATVPVLIAPAMNSVMYLNLATQKNRETLISRGFSVLSAGEGELACDDVGIGRMEEPQSIVNALLPLVVDSKKEPQRWLITAGATKEFLDPIRYLTNGSSGLTGLLIAEYAALMGDEVTLIAASLPRLPRFGVKVISVVSASGMAESVKNNSKDISIFVMSAAVADYSLPPQKTKIKKGEAGLSLELSRTEDILLHSLSYMDKSVVRVGFAAETENLEQNALMKLEKKSLDLICANKIDAEHNPFGASTNKMVLLSKNSRHIVPMQHKESIAKEIVMHIGTLVEKKEMRGVNDE